MNPPDQPLLLDVPRDPVPSAEAPTPATVAPPPLPLRLLDWLIDELLIPAFRPRIARHSVWRFADRTVVLSGTATGVGGRYNSSLTPWTRRFQDVFIDPYIREAHEMKSSRTGFTEAGFNVIRYMPENAPGPAHFAITSAQKATDANKSRVTPTLAASLAPGEWERIDSDDVTGRIVRLRNMEIRFTGSTSESAFRGEGSRLEMVDEVEENGIITGAGTLHNLARSRVTGVDGAKVFTLSKAREWASPHHAECDSGTLEAFLVPCPCCGTFQEMSFDGTSPTETMRIKTPVREIPIKLGRVVFDQCKFLDGSWDLDRVQRETRYECVSGCLIDQDAPITAAHRPAFEAAAALANSPDYTGQGTMPARPRHRLDGFHGAAEVLRRLHAGIRTTMKWAMVNSGQWLETNPRPEPFKVSQHTSDLLSLHADMTWGDLARIFLKNKTTPDGLRFWNNNHMGLPHREYRKAVELEVEQVLRLRGAYRRGTLPTAPDLFLLIVDVQGDGEYQKWLKLAIVSAPDRLHEYVVDWGITGRFDDLLDRAESADPSGPVPIGLTGATAAIQLGLIDEGDGKSTKLVRDFIENAWSSHATWFTTKGRGRGQIHALIQESQYNHPHDNSPPRLSYHYNDDSLKQELYIGQIQDLDKIVAGKSKTPRLWFPADADVEFATEFTHEQLVPDKTKADKTKLSWHKTGTNDYADDVKVAKIAWQILGPQILEAKQKAAAAAAAAKPTTPPPA